MIDFEEKLLLSPEDFKPSFEDWVIDGVLNPAAVRLDNGKIVLYVRVAESSPPRGKVLRCPIIIAEDPEPRHSHEEIHDKTILRRDGNTLFLMSGVCRLSNISHLRRVFLSDDGFFVEKIETKSCFSGKPGESEYGVEDPRISKIGRRHYMTYVGVSTGNGVSTYLAESKDGLSWTRKHILFQEQNKDCVLFPEKIRGKYVALNRPESGMIFSRPSIWVSYSKDLIHWGEEKNILPTRLGSWETHRNGAGIPPIRTEKGWLVIYHGVKEKNDHLTYSAGAFVLDLKNPERVLARSPAKRALITPRKDYEKTGFMNNVVFPTGGVLTKDGKSLLIYSGGADSVITVRKASLEDIFKSLEWFG